MKSLSKIDGYLNESLKAGKINTEGGFGFAQVTRTEDGMGFNVEIKFEGSVMEGELPKDAEAQLKRVINEIEEKISGELDWLQ